MKQTKAVEWSYAFGSFIKATMGILILVFWNNYIIFQANVDPTSTGFMLMVVTLIEISTDPIIGFLSDHLNFPGHKRRILITSALPFIFIFYMLLWVIPDLNSENRGQHNLVYYFFIYTFYKVAMSVFDINYEALLSEMTDEYSERIPIVAKKLFMYVIFCILAVFINIKVIESYGETSVNLVMLSMIIGIIGIIFGVICAFMCRENQEGHDSLFSKLDNEDEFGFDENQNEGDDSSVIRLVPSVNNSDDLNNPARIVDYMNNADRNVEDESNNQNPYDVVINGNNNNNNNIRQSEEKHVITEEPVKPVKTNNESNSFNKGYLKDSPKLKTILFTLITMKRDYAVILSNTNFLLIALINLCVSSTLSMMMVSILTYNAYVLKDDPLKILMRFQFGFLFGLFFYNFITQYNFARDKRTTLIRLLLTLTLPFIYLTFFPHFKFIDFFIGNLISGILLMLGSMVLDTIDKGQSLHSSYAKRDGAYFGIYIIFSKIGAGMSMIIYNFTLGSVGYGSLKEMDISQVITKLLFIYPLAMTCISLLFMIPYGITREEHEGIMKHIKEGIKTNTNIKIFRMTGIVNKEKNATSNASVSV